MAVSVLLIPNVYAFLSSQVTGKHELQRIAETVSTNQTNVTETVRRIVDWESKNMNWDTKSIQFWPFPPFMVFRTALGPEWVMTTKRGGCEEYSILFLGIAKEAGIEGRVVHNIAEDHVWSEVLINGTWTHIDPTLSFEKGFNNPIIYELPKGIGWGKQISYVTATYSNRTEQDVTKSYTGTGRLTILVKKDGVPVKDALVKIGSMFLMENNPNYSAPIFFLEKTTNESGLCEFELGGNNYTVIAQIGSIIGPNDEKTCTLNENSEVTLTMNIDKTGLLLPSQTIIMVSIVIVELIILSGLIILVRRRKSKRLPEQFEDSNISSDARSFTFN
jgi:hypothetical protein